jgi:hypothetical protein
MRVAHDVHEFDDVGATAQILEDLDLAPDLLLFHWFEDFHDALL